MPSNSRVVVVVGYSWSVVVELLSIAFQNGDFGEKLTGVDAQGAG